VEGQCSSPSRASTLGDSRERPSTRGSHAQTWRPRPHMREQPIRRWPSGDWIESPPPTAYNVEPSGNIPPPCLQKTRRGEGNMMVLTPQRRWARVPSTHPSGMVRPLEPRAPERRPKASCSPIVGMGRLAPTTLFGLSSGETVEAPARMPVQGGAAMPSHGGREGID